MDDVIFSEDSQIFKVQYLRNYAIKMHRVNAKKFQKIFSKDLFYKINNDSDFIAPLISHILKDVAILLLLQRELNVSITLLMKINKR